LHIPVFALFIAAVCIFLNVSVQVLLNFLRFQRIFYSAHSILLGVLLHTLSFTHCTVVFTHPISPLARRNFKIDFEFHIF
jgi:hypothetical protein